MNTLRKNRRKFKTVNPSKHSNNKLPATKGNEYVYDVTEEMKRPETLLGSTYKITNPMYDHAMYITINDVTLNKGTSKEIQRPYELLINSKNMDHFQWTIALTRIISAIFRKGGDNYFLKDELNNVFDPKGGYFKKGRYINSIVSEIGDIIGEHLVKIGAADSPQLDEHQQAFLEKKKEELSSVSLCSV